MHGLFQIRVKNSRNTYTFALRRNLSLLVGDSGRGKTTLFDMIREHNRFGKNSGVAVSSDRPLIAIEGIRWEEEVSANPGAILVIDEDSQFIRSKEFAAAVRGSDNYYLLITRNYLSELPVSVDEIFELTGAKNKKFKRVYQEIERMYDHPSASSLPFHPEMLITEDSGSGFQFFRHEADRMGIPCISAEGKTKILHLLDQYADKNVVIIADGAAFGAEIGDIAAQQRLRPNKLAIFLPESFEWILLRAGIVTLKNPEKLEKPEMYADSVLYMSWEQYFTALLTDSSKEPEHLRYKKKQLPEYYLQEKTANAVKDVIKGIRWEQHN